MPTVVGGTAGVLGKKAEIELKQFDRPVIDFDVNRTTQRTYNNNNNANAINGVNNTHGGASRNTGQKNQMMLGGYNQLSGIPIG